MNAPRTKPAKTAIQKAANLAALHGEAYAVFRLNGDPPTYKIAAAGTAASLPSPDAARLMHLAEPPPPDMHTCTHCGESYNANATGRTCSICGSIQ